MKNRIRTLAERLMSQLKARPNDEAGYVHDVELVMKFLEDAETRGAIKDNFDRWLSEYYCEFGHEPTPHVVKTWVERHNLQVVFGSGGGSGGSGKLDWFLQELRRRWPSREAIEKMVKDADPFGSDRHKLRDVLTVVEWARLHVVGND